MSAPERISLEDAQAQIDGRLVAEILRDFQLNFKGVYPAHLLSRGVGPEQSMIGLAIKRGHLMVATPSALAASPELQALIREAVEVERERCVGIADAEAASRRRISEACGGTSFLAAGGEGAAEAIAAAIRAQERKT